MRGSTAAQRNDPHFYDTPWEIFYDNKGQIIGELYLYSEPEHDRLPRKRRRRRKKK